MLYALIVALALSQLSMVLWVKRTIRQNEDRCEAKRQLQNRLARCGG